MGNYPPNNYPPVNGLELIRAYKVSLVFSGCPVQEFWDHTKIFDSPVLKWSLGFGDLGFWGCLGFLSLGFWVLGFTSTRTTL